MIDVIRICSISLIGSILFFFMVYKIIVYLVEKLFEGMKRCVFLINIDNVFILDGCIRRVV